MPGDDDLPRDQPGSMHERPLTGPGGASGDPAGVASRIAGRKRDHLAIHLGQDTSAGGPVWAPYVLRHDALPTFDLDDVDLCLDLFGKHLNAPLVITGMTGGCDEAHHVNDHLAAAAAEHQIPMGVGSQRAALEHVDLRPSYAVIRNHDVPLVFANLGMPQLVHWGPKRALEMAEAAVAMVEADVLAIHLNYLQECAMPEGDTDAKGAIEVLGAVADDLDVPILVKETGAGIGGDVARRVLAAGAKGLDVGGLGGTSFSAVESYRAAAEQDTVRARIGHTFWDWGIPTPRCLEEARRPGGPFDGADGRAGIDRAALLATGGVRNGLDGAKAIALGADAFGMAGAMLRAADRSKEAAQGEVATVLQELRVACFLTGSRDLDALGRPEVWLRRP